MGWFLVTIVVPLTAPVVILFPVTAIANASGGARFVEVDRSSQRWTAVLGRHDILCFGALRVCSHRRQFFDGSCELLQLSNGLANVCLVVSSIVAMGGALYPTPIEKQENVGWLRHFSCFCVSAIIALASAWVYAIIHFEGH